MNNTKGAHQVVAKETRFRIEAGGRRSFRYAKKLVEEAIQ